MGSQYPPGFYDDNTLRVIEGAFREVWHSLAASNPNQDTDRQGLKVAVIDRLLGLVEQGITDPEDLRALTLSHFTDQPRN